MITERDLEMLRWINGFDFVTGAQVADWMGVGQRVGQRRLQKLEAEGLISRDRFLMRMSSVVKVTSKARHLTGDTLPPVRKLSFGNFEHCHELVSLSLKLVRDNPGSWFWSERRYRHENGLQGYGEKGRVADGYLMLENGNKIAIELELSYCQM